VCFCCRATVVDRRLEGGEDPRNLFRGIAGVRRQPKEAQAGHNIRETPVSTN
jgi:hypothetical protein